MKISTRDDSFKDASPVRSIQVAEICEKDLANVDAEEVKRAVRKLDYALIPLMTMFYLLSFIDRTNIGNARVAGLQSDLGLTDHQYQICITATYVPYIVTELPSNLVLRKLGPRYVMPTLLTIWGLICTLQGLVTNYAGLVCARAFLGLVEGPMFPGIVLYLSGFYTRRQLSLRIAMFFSAASLSGAFSGLLAAAIMNMDGINGRPGWAWIFILEGIFTILIGLISFFITPSTPQDVRWLTKREKDIIMKRLVLDRPMTSFSDVFSWSQVLTAITSPHVFIVFCMMFLNGTALFGLALFLPTIVNQLGYTSTMTQLVSVGPYAAGFAVTIVSSYLSDRYQRRSVSAAVNSVITMTGFIVFLRSNSKAVSYGSLFLSVSGTYALPPQLSAWLSNNSEPHYRRATAVALGFVGANSGGILSTWIFPSKEGPRFKRATILNLSFSVCIFGLSILNVLYLTWATQKKQSERAETLAPYIKEDLEDPNVRRDGGDRAWVELGDKHPDFHYAI
ncbi:hypothetical protein ACEPAF_7069 [Sanghuangporus sanghuang]